MCAAIHTFADTRIKRSATPHIGNEIHVHLYSMSRCRTKVPKHCYRTKYPKKKKVNSNGFPPQNAVFCLGLNSDTKMSSVTTLPTTGHQQRRKHPPPPSRATRPKPPAASIMRSVTLSRRYGTVPNLLLLLRRSITTGPLSLYLARSLTIQPTSLSVKRGACLVFRRYCFFFLSSPNATNNNDNKKTSGRRIRRT